MKTAIPMFILAVSFGAAALEAATIQSSNTFDFYNPTSSTYNSIANSNLILSTVSQTFNRDSTTVLLEKFNTTLGTLNSVTFTVSLSTSETSGTVSFPTVGLISAATIQRTISLTVDLAAFSSAVGTSAVSTVTTNQLLLGSGLQSYGPIAGPTGFTTSSFTSAPQLTAVSASAPGQTYGVHLTSSDIYTISKVLGAGTNTLSGRTHYIGSVVATYNYTPIPEPSALWLLIGAVGFFGGGAYFLRFRKGEFSDPLSGECK